jgi:hypothetical protein
VYALASLLAKRLADSRGKLSLDTHSSMAATTPSVQMA